MKFKVFVLGLLALSGIAFAQDQFFQEYGGNWFQCTSTNASDTEYDCIATSGACVVVESDRTNLGACGTGHIYDSGKVKCEERRVIQCPDGSRHSEVRYLGCVERSRC